MKTITYYTIILFILFITCLTQSTSAQAKKQSLQISEYQPRRIQRSLKNRKPDFRYALNNQQIITLI